MIYLFCDPGGARTHDPMIKSHLLYQLSHGVNLSCWSSGLFPDCECKITTFFRIDQILSHFFTKKSVIIRFIITYKKREPLSQFSSVTPVGLEPTTQ